MTKEKEERLEREPSATEDCADVTSRYDRYKKSIDKPKFPPIEYEKPPHH
jgi:hypothetical protein